MKPLANVAGFVVACVAVGVILAGALIAAVTVLAGGGHGCSGRVVLDPSTVVVKTPVYRCEVPR